MIDPLHAALIAQAVQSVVQDSSLKWEPSHSAVRGRDRLRMVEARKETEVKYRILCAILGITPLDLGKLGNSSPMFCCCCVAPATIDNMVMGGNGCRVCREQSEVSESTPPHPKHDAVGRRI